MRNFLPVLLSFVFVGISSYASSADSVTPHGKTWKTIEEMTAAEKADVDLRTETPRDSQVAYLPVEKYPFAPPYTAEGEGDEAETALVRRMLGDFETVVKLDPNQWLLSYDRFKLRHVPRLEELGLVERAYADQRWIQKK